MNWPNVKVQFRGRTNTNHAGTTKNRYRSNRHPQRARANPRQLQRFVRLPSRVHVGRLEEEGGFGLESEFEVVDKIEYRIDDKSNLLFNEFANFLRLLEAKSPKSLASLD